MPASIEETYGFSVLVKSRVDYDSDGPSTDAEVREKASAIATRLRALFERKTSARVTVFTVDAKYGSAVTDHLAELSFERFEDWRQWMFVFFEFPYMVEEWVEEEWRLMEHGRGITDVNVDVAARTRASNNPASNPATPSSGSASQRDAERAHRLQLYVLLTIAFILGGIASLAFFTYTELRRDLDEVLRHTSETTSQSTPQSVVVTYPPSPPQPARPVVVRPREPPCTNCPVIRRAPSP